MDDGAAQAHDMANALRKPLYVMTRTIRDVTLIAPAMDDHHRWLIALEKQGRIFASGPTFERDGRPAAGMTVFRAASHEDAEAMAAQDPFVTCGAAHFEIMRWQLNEGRIGISIDFSDKSYQFS